VSNANGKSKTTGWSGMMARNIGICTVVESMRMHVVFQQSTKEKETNYMGKRYALPESLERRVSVVVSLIQHRCGLFLEGTCAKSHRFVKKIKILFLPFIFESSSTMTKHCQPAPCTHSRWCYSFETSYHRSRTSQQPVL
jgi:hypothetical protein